MHFKDSSNVMAIFRKSFACYLPRSMSWFKYIFHHKPRKLLNENWYWYSFQPSFQLILIQLISKNVRTCCTLTNIRIQAIWKLPLNINRTIFILFLDIKRMQLDFNNSLDAYSHWKRNSIDVRFIYCNKIGQNIAFNETFKSPGIYFNVNLETECISK